MFSLNITPSFFHLPMFITVALWLSTMSVWSSIHCIRWYIRSIRSRIVWGWGFWRDIGRYRCQGYGDLGADWGGLVRVHPTSFYISGDGCCCVLDVVQVTSDYSASIKVDQGCTVSFHINHLVHLRAKQGIKFVPGVVADVHELVWKDFCLQSVVGCVHLTPSLFPCYLVCFECCFDGVVVYTGTWEIFFVS